MPTVTKRQRIGGARQGPRLKVASTVLDATPTNHEKAEDQYRQLQSFIDDMTEQHGKASPIARLLSPNLLRWFAEQMENGMVPDLYGAADNYRRRAGEAEQQAQTLAKDRAGLERQLAEQHRRLLGSTHTEAQGQELLDALRQRTILALNLTRVIGMLEAEEAEQTGTLGLLLVILNDFINVLQGVIDFRRIVGDAWLNGTSLKPEDLRQPLADIADAPAEMLSLMDSHRRHYSERAEFRNLGLDTRAPMVSAWRDEVRPFLSGNALAVQSTLEDQQPETPPKGRVVVGEVHMRVNLKHRSGQGVDPSTVSMELSSPGPATTPPPPPPGAVLSGRAPFWPTPTAGSNPLTREEIGPTLDPLAPENAPERPVEAPDA